MDQINKIWKLLATDRVRYFLGIFIVLAFTVAYCLLLLNRYWQFTYFFVDNVLFDTAIWKVAHGLAPLVHHTILGTINILGDHFHPTIFLFSVIYLFTSRQEGILLGTSLVYGASAILAMLTGFRLISNKLITLILLVPYFTYVGTQNAMIYGFHEVNLMPLFFWMTIYALVTSKNKLYWLSLGLLLLTKESFAILALTIGWFIFLAYPKQKKVAIITIIVAIFYFIILTKLVIPHFSGRYLYGEASLPPNTYEIIQKLYIPHEKVSTFLVSEATFGLLPLLNIATMPMVLYDFVLRYLFTLPGTLQYLLSYHYNLIQAPIMLLASFWTVSLWRKNNFLTKLVPVAMVIVASVTIYLFRFSHPAWPLLLTVNKSFYDNTTDNKFLWELVDKTPWDGKIMTQNNLGYPLAHRDIYPLATDLNIFKVVDPKYVVLDLRSGQDPNNLAPLTPSQAKTLFAQLTQSGVYQVIFQKGDMVILKKQKEWPKV